MDPFQRPVWYQREGVDDKAAATLGLALGIAPLTARVLLLRGIATETDGRNFLAGRLSDLPDPDLLLDMEPAVERLALARERGEPVAVHGDYDVDGIAGTALLVETLRSFGYRVTYSIPSRLRDGYGLSAEALRRSAGEGARVVITVDCGVSAHEEAALASTLGLDLIITDHHQPPAVLPQARAVLNPHRPGCRFPFKDLAGVGVAFFFLVALRKRLRQQGVFSPAAEPDLRRGLDLVALGTIADVVPLKGVNRLLTRYGLGMMGQGGRAGLEALQRVAGVREVTCGAVGFGLAPRLNAAGRLEEAGDGVDLLLTDDPERAGELSAYLDDCNRQRQKIEQETLRQALVRLEGASSADRRSIVLADEQWHPGVIGIVASRLVERMHRPAVLISLEGVGGRGSGRSIPGFHLYRALERCRDHLAGFGGHAAAAGLTIEASRIEAFAAAFEAVAGELLTEEDLRPRLGHDGEVGPEELGLDGVRELSRLAPFGAGNPEPSFVFPGVRVQQVRPVGEGHLRFTARQGGISFPCIAFGQAPRQQELAGEIDLLITPTLNTWQGRTSVQLRVKDFRPAGEKGS